ncbi:MAG: gliding motility-associated C-terminal domain-containing protein [Bacteroidota bacterium]|nr:gliding motility-associated C-terminal domain-containing protein [Bacteroidota bacterium]
MTSANPNVSSFTRSRRSLATAASGLKRWAWMGLLMLCWGELLAQIPPVAPTLTHFNGIDELGSGSLQWELNVPLDEYVHNKFWVTYLDGNSAQTGQFGGIIINSPMGQWEVASSGSGNYNFDAQAYCIRGINRTYYWAGTDSINLNSPESSTLCSIYLKAYQGSTPESVLLSWNSPYHVSTDAAGGDFRLQRKTSSMGDWEDLIGLPDSPNGGSYEDTLGPCLSEVRYRIQQVATDGIHVHESNVEVWTVASNASNVPEVSHVNVTSADSLAEVHWVHDPGDNDNFGYIVYSCNGGAATPVDTVGEGVFSTVVLNSSAWVASEEYRVAAINCLGDDDEPMPGGASDCARSMHLGVIYRPCDEEAGLAWNRPDLLEGVTQYQVQTKTLQPGSNWEILDVIEDNGSGSALAYVHNNVPLQTTLRYRIVALGGANQQSASNEVEMTFDYQDTPATPVLEAALVRTDLAPGVPVEVRVNVGEGYQGHEYELQRLNKDTDSWTGLERKGTANPEVIFTDYDVNTDEFSYRYRIAVYNECEQLVSQSQEAETMLLQGFRNDELGMQRHNLSWSHYDGFPFGVDRYEVLVKTTTDPSNYGQPLETMDANRSNFNRNVSDMTGDPGLFCYQIIAVEVDPEGDLEAASSNWLCLVEEPVVWLPNAFTPNGDDLNDWYPWTADAPNVGFIGDAPEGSSNFRLSIFNRWGNVVYETESIGTPWDGKVNGKLVPNGVYMVKCQYLDGIGTWHSQHQSLTVLFPE